MTREEAIKIVQNATVWTAEEREALAMLIPELAESEDERIIDDADSLIDFTGKTPEEAIDMASKWFHRKFCND